MHLVDAHGLIQGVVPVAPGHPLLVFPGIIQVPHDGGGARRAFEKKGKGVRFVNPVAAVARDDVILVQRAFAQPGDQAFPESGLGSLPQGVARLVPLVEIPGYGDLFRIRSPHGKIGPLLSLLPDQMGPQFVVETVLIPFIEEVEIVVGEQGEVMPHWPGWDGPFSFRHVVLLP